MGVSRRLKGQMRGSTEAWGVGIWEWGSVQANCLCDTCISSFRRRPESRSAGHDPEPWRARGRLSSVRGLK